MYCFFGHFQVKILIGMKDFKKGIYEIEWDIDRLQMLEKILIEKIRYIQLLRNTKGITPFYVFLKPKN